MPREIERKFLLKDPTAIDGHTGVALSQAYLSSGGVSVRVRTSSDTAWLTLKTTEPGMSRKEFEYEIPMADAREMLALPGLLGKLTKTRYAIEHAGFTFEVDIFAGPLKGLATVEVELPSEDTPVSLPDWVGEELTHRKDYSNESLARYGLPVDFRKPTY